MDTSYLVVPARANSRTIKRNRSQRTKSAGETRSPFQPLFAPALIVEARPKGIRAASRLSNPPAPAIATNAGGAAAAQPFPAHPQIVRKRSRLIRTPPPSKHTRQSARPHAARTAPPRLFQPFPTSPRARVRDRSPQGRDARPARLDAAQQQRRCTPSPPKRTWSALFASRWLVQADGRFRHPAGGPLQGRLHTRLSAGFLRLEIGKDI
jgi:hypothetical protein